MQINYAKANTLRRRRASGCIFVKRYPKTSAAQSTVAK